MQIEISISIIEGIFLLLLTVALGVPPSNTLLSLLEDREFHLPVEIPFKDDFPRNNPKILKEKGLRSAEKSGQY